MLLDTSDAAWDMFLEIAHKARVSKAIWYSPDKNHPYHIRDIDTSIVIGLDKGQPQRMGRDGFIRFLTHFSDGKTELKRCDHNSTVAKETCIVTFHPMLKWSEDKKAILIVNTPGRGIAAYKDFDAPPNDDPEELQIFARKVRHGQPAFRKALLKAYKSRCCITGCDVEEALDACHILPHSKSGINDIKNGLLLRADIHNLFDADLLTIEPATHRIHLAPALQATEYRNLPDKLISTFKPGDNYLQQRNQAKGSA